MERIQEHVTLELDGVPVEVVSVEGTEAISSLFRFDLLCHARATDPAPADLLGREGKLTLHDGSGLTRTVTGIVTDAESRHHDDGGATLRVSLRPAAYPLTLGRSCRVYQDLDVVGIARKILGQLPIHVRYETTGSYPKREYTAQYREDDWTFLSRLLDEEGIYVWFDHQDSGSTLVLADDSRGAPDLIGGAPVVFAPASGMHTTAEAIEEWATEVQVTPTRFTVASFDPRRPAFKVSATQGSGPLEVYGARGGGPDSPDVCGARARTRAEAATAEGGTAAGLSTSIRLIPGRVFEITDHPLSSFEGRYFLTEATYKIDQRSRGDRSGDESRPYACRFRAIPAKEVFRSPLDMPKARQSGLQTGVVVGAAGEEIRPDPGGRVRVQHHWDREGARDEHAGKWMRVAQRGTAESMLLPRIGWTVLTFNEEGVLDAPSVLSRIFDGEHVPPYGLPDNKTRVVFKTATSPGGGSHNEIRYEDKDDAQEMFINASRDMSVLVLDLKRETVVRDSSRSIGVDQEHSVALAYSQQVGADQTVAIGASETVSTAKRTKNVSGNETITIGGKRSLKVGGTETLTVDSSRKLTVGSVMLDATLGDVTARADKRRSILVGGAMVKAAAKSISEDVGIASAQTVGGAKLELVKKRRVLEVAKIYAETVGGAIILKTDEAYNDHADTTSAWTVGGLMQGEAPDLWVEAAKKIEVKCGSSTMTITTDSVEIKSDELDLSAAENLDSFAELIKHN